MPANLPPEYIEAEQRFRDASSDQEKLDALEEMLALLPNHKGTDKIEADIRRRISDLKERAKKDKGPTKQKTPDQIEPQGAGQVVLVGLPNTGKSAIVDMVTNAEPQVEDFPFSTYGPTVGMMPYEDIQVQLIDIPPLSTEHVKTWVYNLLRKAHLLLLLVDLSTEGPIQQLNKAVGLLEEQGIYLFSPREDFDKHAVGRTNKQVLLIATKADDTDEDRLTKLQENSNLPVTPVSILDEDALSQFKQDVYEGLGLIRIYTKKPGKDPDLDEPYLLDQGSTVFDAAREIHRDLAQDLDYVRIWGSGRFDGQQVAQDHLLEEGDIIEIHRE